MNILPLFRGPRIYISAPDSGLDAEIEAKWSEDASYLALIQKQIAQPLSSAQIRKKGRPAENQFDIFQFAIRRVEDHQLLGFVELRNIQWNHGIAWVAIRLGDPTTRGQGYGREALRLIELYAFYELNLNHLIAEVYEYNLTAQHFFEKSGYSVEVRQREVLQRFGRRWDIFLMGLLRSDWETNRQASEGGNHE